ncbi:MAG: hypothetical protein IT368_09525, partial [Candidatus Hydrogenedentes bacterium]|nr:hypothetical protein [Candidatus Hydrogenedentota bacterium]
MTRAVAEINGIDLATTKMLSDTGRNSLNDMFNPAKVWSEARSVDGTVLPGQFTAAQFNRARQIYTRVIYALLRDGRAVLNAADTIPTNVGGLSGVYGDYINANVQKNLGTSYVPELGNDPWGELYQIFPGPWSRVGGPSPNVFRTYSLTASEQNLPGAGSAKPDRLTFATVAPEGDPNTPETVGYPAPSSKAAFIYSTGQNLISGQAQYQQLPQSLINAPYDVTVHYPSTNGSVYYNGSQEDYLKGGGDDVNNWDSGASWGRFYN